MKRLSVCIFTIAIALFCMVSCRNSGSRKAVLPTPDPIEEAISAMTLREKVGQLFCVRPESFDVTLQWEDNEQLAAFQVQDVNERMHRVNAKYPVGGIIVFAHNIKDPGQLLALTDSLHAFNGSPLLYIDEEGGRVARIANNPAFNLPKYRSMSAIGNTGDPAKAYECGHTIGQYLKQYGFDVDLAPVADVNTNPRNPVIGPRAFSDKPEVAAKMVVKYLEGLKDAGIAGCVKHFPGHGDTQADTHFGYAQSGKTWEEMLGCEMVTFRAAIQADVPLIMTAHIAVPKVTGSSIPSTLSEVVLQEKLRKELGYKNVIITDGMAMGAITRHYKPGEAAVKSLQAGADIILGPKNFIEAFDAVMAAVADSTLTEERIDESVRRVLQLKQKVKRAF